MSSSGGSAVSQPRRCRSLLACSVLLQYCRHPVVMQCQLLWKQDVGRRTITLASNLFDAMCC